MAHLLHDVSRGKKYPAEFDVIIEIPKNTPVKYEVDKANGLLRFDRLFYGKRYCPADYGFVPQTLWDDGDPLDVLVLTTHALHPLSIITCRAIGVLELIDGGESDFKTVAVPVKDPHFNSIKTFLGVSPALLRRIRHFYATYKIHEKKKVEVKRFHSVARALACLERAKKMYVKKYGAKK